MYQASAIWNSGLELYEISLLNNGNYAANQLYKTKIFDENTASSTYETKGLTEEFKNKEGQLVLKRKYGHANYSDPVLKHDTYYIYDQFGNLTYVLPPLVNTNATITQQILDGLCYQYKYDSRNRLVEKKLPGKQWEFIVYDKLDRVVATGPAFSPFSDSPSGTVGWMITKYDAFNRPVYTGWEQSTTINNAGRVLKQNTINGATTLSESKTTTATTIDSLNGIAYYTNTVAPTDFKLLAVNYYDDYNFQTFTPAITFTSPVAYNNTTLQPKGLPTGSWIRVLTTLASTSGDSSYTLYDAKARPIKSFTANYLGGYTQIDSNLDPFSGQLNFTETRHKRISSDTEKYIKEAFTYTDQDRVLTHTHQIGTGGTPQLLASNSYDELGQLIAKKVGNNATNPLQKIDYSHNIRGWLRGINTIDNLNQGNDPKDLFTFTISYNTLTGYNFFPDGSPEPQYNGNISETFWRTASDNLVRGYHYIYDGSDRLYIAQYGKSGLATGAYNEGILYDKNGNITRLGRSGDSDAEVGNFEIDNLYYTYATNSNKLISVTDVYNNTSGFNDGNTIGDDYDYDTNGNMTIDRNKNITLITYNHLNLPTKITFGTTGSIVYIYNALGQKVEKQVFTSNQGSVPVIHYYLNGFQYVFRENYADYLTKLQFVPTAEGYYDYVNTKYVFNYTDHLGNVRLSYAKNLTTDVLEIIEESNYYPFGLKHKGYNGNNSQLGYKYKYNGKELQDELSLNLYDYGARNYDPALGRWMNMDPLAEMSRRFSPYTYAVNNPVYFIDPDGMMQAPNGGSYIDDDKHKKKDPIELFSGQNDQENGRYRDDDPNHPPSDYINKSNYEPNYIAGENSKAESSSESLESDGDCCPNGIDPGPAIVAAGLSYATVISIAGAGPQGVVLEPAAAVVAVGSIVVGTLVSLWHNSVNIDNQTTTTIGHYDSMSQGKGERGQTRKADGTDNPFKKLRDDPNKPGNVLEKNSHTGKVVSKPAPPGYKPKK